MGISEDNALGDFYTSADARRCKKRIAFVKGTKIINQHKVKIVIDLVLNELILPSIETENGKRLL